jgi:hypothetical protein
MRRLSSLAFYFLLAVTGTGSIRTALAASWYVKPDGSGDAPTIQAALNLASSGDEVVVAAGTYPWSTQHGDSAALNGPTLLTMRSGVYLRSEAGPLVTIIDAENRGRVLRLEAVANVRIEGFTIQGGYAATPGATGPYSKGLGGGILCRYSSSVEIVGNMIKANRSRFGGGGIGILDSDLLIRDNVVFNNTSDLGVAGIEASGGGTVVQMSENTIAENVGGGVFCASGTGTLARKLIFGNMPSDRVEGFGVSCLFSSMALECNNSWANQDGDYQCTIAPSDISEDPLFCQEAPFYKVYWGSPCLPDNNDCGVRIGAVTTCETSDLVSESPHPPTWIRASPNPFNPQTEISFMLPASLQRVSLSIYDLRGRRVARLLDGYYTGIVGSVIWTGFDDAGVHVSTGVYIAQLAIGPKLSSTKLVLVK